MDLYTEGAHRQREQFVTDLSSNELSSLERDTEEAQTPFEPLDVQLKFELGSLVDTHVLIETDGSRESHWDFVRREQGRFQESSEDTNVALSHEKQDESLNNCHSWSQSASQEDTGMFIDAQDDVRMITEAFAGKDKSLVEVVDDDRVLLVQSLNLQCKEESAWIGNDKQPSEDKALESSSEAGVEGTIEVTQISIKNSNARINGRSFVKSGECQQTPIETHNESHQSEHQAADVSGELCPSAEQIESTEAVLAPLTINKPQSSLEIASSKGENQDEKGPLECSKRCAVDLSRDLGETIHSEPSRVDVEELGNFERVDSIEEEDPRADNLGLLCTAEEKPKMVLNSSRTAAEAMPAKNLLLASDLACTVSDNDFSQRTALGDKSQRFGSEVVCQPLALVEDTGMATETKKSFLNPEGSHLGSGLAGSCIKPEVVLIDGSENKSSAMVESSLLSSERQETQAIGTHNVPVPEKSQKRSVLSLVEASSTTENAFASKEIKTLDKNKDFVKETSDSKQKMDSSQLAAEPSHNVISAEKVTASLASERDGACPAAHQLDHTDLHESGTERLENNNSVTGLEKAEVIQGTSVAAKPSAAETCSSHLEITKEKQLASKTLHMSGGDSEIASLNNRHFHEHALNTIVGAQHSSKSINNHSVEDSPSKESLEKQIAGHDVQDDLKDGPVANDRNKFVLQEQKNEKHTNDKNAMDGSLFSTKAHHSNEDNDETDTSHPGGVLHVLLDVHKDGTADGCLTKNASTPGHLTTVESGRLPDDQDFNPTVITGQEYGIDCGKVAAGCLDSHVPGLVAQGTREDVNPTNENSRNRKADLSIRNSRLKDSIRVNSLQVRSDEEHRKVGPEGSGRRKATPKSMSQKKGVDSVKNLTSPQKTVSKCSGEIRNSLLVVQDTGKETCHTPSSTVKAVFAGSVRHHAPPDVSGLEVMMPRSSQPFSEPQQVQLRAQILVYGSLIQGVAPEEALMVAAFSNVGGGHIGRDSELTDGAVWEKQWKAAIDRIHSKTSRDGFNSRPNSALMSNSPVATTKPAEGSTKPSGSSGMTNNAIDSNRPAGLLVRPLDVSGTKGQLSRARQSTDSSHDVSVNSHQAIVAGATALGSVTAAASRTAVSTLAESFSPPSKPRIDFQKIAPQSFFPTPSLGPFMTGPPQWFSSSSFPVSWMPQSQTMTYANPCLFTHAQAAASLDQTSEMRKSTPFSSGAGMLSNSFSTAIFTPVIGNVSLMPTPIADQLTTKHTTSESRPRKRKKTQSESYGQSTGGKLSYATGSMTVVGASATSTESQVQIEQTYLGTTNPIQVPLPTTPEALAVVVASTQLTKSSQETSLVPVPPSKVPFPCSANMPSAGLQSVRNFGDKSIDLQSSADHLSQAQASAEEAALAAASALRESEQVWSQLKAQKSLGLIPDIESQLVSSAVAVATAASVAKAAAAAAKAAYEAAAQAKRVGESVLEVAKEATDFSRLLGDKAETTSQAFGIPESFNSILTAAKMASKQRLEAVSTARARAENFETVIRAAELAANAISQVGSVMAMGESVPFTLDMLLEAGPEGLLMLEDKIKTKFNGMALRSPDTTSTPKSLGRDKKLSSSNETAGQRDPWMDSWTSDAILSVRPENEMRIDTELGIGLVTELNQQKAADPLDISTPSSKQGLLITRTESGLMEQGVLGLNVKIGKGSLVEVMSDEKGLCGVWFSARVQSLNEEKVFVLYDDLLADDGYSPLEEWIQLKGSSGKAPRIRLAHPNTHIGFEGTRKRRREAMGSHKWSVGDCVDVWIRDGWWEGEIKEIIEDGEIKAKVFFHGDNETSIVKTSKLRPSLLWNNGHWVLWNDAKKDLSRATVDPHEGETPFAKRQKTESTHASSLKQKLMPGNSAGFSSVHIEPNLFGSNTTNLATDLKGLVADSIAKPRLQTSKIVFGIPRPTKKRKLIEVSKRFGSARGISGAGTFEAKSANNKTESALVFASGPPAASRISLSKAKKRVFHEPKARLEKDPITDVKAISKKEKVHLPSKTILGKNTLNKDGFPILPKNKEGDPTNKKIMRSENNQVEPREQFEGRALPEMVETRTTSSILHPDIDNESKKNDVDHESRKEQIPAPNMTDGNQISTSQASNTEKEKPLARQAKDGDIKSSATASGKESAVQFSKRREAAPSKENEETVRKGPESHPNHEGEKKLEPPGRKPNLMTSIEKQYTHSAKGSEKNKEEGKPVPETWEPRRTSRKIQPTSKLLEGLQTAPKLGKNCSSHDRGHRGISKAHSQA